MKKLIPQDRSAGALALLRGGDCLRAPARRLGARLRSPDQGRPRHRPGGRPRRPPRRRRGGRADRGGGALHRSVAREEVVDAGGLVVTPGLVDIHTHVFFGTVDGAYLANSYTAVWPDAFAPRSCTTTVVDAGSSGRRSFDVFERQTIAHAKTRVLAFLNIVGGGMRGGQLEQDLGDMDARATADAILAHPRRDRGRQGRSLQRPGVGSGPPRRRGCPARGGAGDGRLRRARPRALARGASSSTSSARATSSPMLTPGCLAARPSSTRRGWSGPTSSRRGGAGSSSISATGAAASRSIRRCPRSGRASCRTQSAPTCTQRA